MYISHMLHTKIKSEVTRMEFEIKKQEYVNKTFRITKELADKLAATAQQEGVSVNELVVQSCEFALEHLKKQD